MNQKSVVLGILSLMVLVVSAIQTFSNYLYLINHQIRQILPHSSLSDFYNNYFLARLLTYTPYWIFMLFSVVILYIMTSLILHKAQESDSNLKYSMGQVIIVLWIFGILGAVCAEFLGIYVYPSHYGDFLPIILLGKILSLLITPFLPVLIVLFQMAYKNLLSSQSQIEGVPEGEIIDLRSFSQSFLLKITCIVILAITFAQIVRGSWLTQNTRIWRILFSFFDPTVFGSDVVVTLVRILVDSSNILIYLLLYLITNIALRKEREKNLGYSYVLKDTVLALWGFGTLGTLSATIITEAIALLSVTPPSYSEYVFHPLRLLEIGAYILFVPPLILIFIVLFQIAYKKRFYSQLE